ncbi:MAG: nucleotide exchange factor GrpE [Treponema sp.]|nr:nucleotide exchange factor GrpE [Treponema sp.]
MSKKETQSEIPDAEKDQADENGAEMSAEGVNEPENQPQEAEAAVTDAKPLTAEEKIATLEAQVAEIRDQLLRKAADFENFRKRMNQEKQGAIEYANQSLLLDIIPVIDDFERAIQAGESSTDLSGFLDGIKMIEKRLTSQLEGKWGLKRFNCAGELFDPNIHEALMMEKSPDVSEPTVQEEFAKGYLLKDRVIRAAKVKVLMPEETGA